MKAGDTKLKSLKLALAKAGASHGSQLPNMKTTNLIKILVISIAIVFAGMECIYGLPKVDEVTNGNADIQVSDTTMTINASDNTIINYSSFDILQNESVFVTLPSTNSQILNRVTGNNPSDLLGTLNCNGIFILVNTSGIYVGQSANISAAGLVLSTRDITDTNFINGEYLFEKMSQEHLDMLLLNEGTINITNGGFGVLIAGAIENEGIITAQIGKIALASGDAVRLKLAGNDLISVAIDEKVASTILDFNGRPITDQIKNAGRIEADGGTVILNAKSITDIFKHTMRLEGTVEAKRLEERDGLIKLVADADVAANGKLEASHIEIVSTANITSLGAIKAATLIEKGASFKVGGIYDVSMAHLQNSDNAVILTTGEYSGETADAADIIVDTNAVITLNGNTIFRADSDTDGTGAFIMNAGSSIFSETGSSYDLTLYSSQNATLGSISNVNTLTIYESQPNLNPTYTANSNISVTNFILTSGTFVSSPTNIFTVSENFSIPDTAGAFSRFSGSGTEVDPYIVTDVYALQAVKGFLSSHFQLSSDIDASVTENWNDGLGFVPIGNGSIGTFAGTFNGNSHVITGLYINRPNESYVGLFGYNNGAIQNIGLTSENVTGSYYVGGLVGYNSNTAISNSYTAGQVTNSEGSYYAGGLVGYNENSAITNSYSTGNVTSAENSYFIGGLVGYNSNSPITDSYATGDVTVGVNSYYTGGLVGYNENGAITNSYATGNVTSGESSYYTGGLVGGNNGYNAAITNSYAAGDVTGGTGSDGVGGLVGDNYYSPITDSYSTGEVTGTTSLGGLIGYNEGSTITNSYYNIDEALINGAAQITLGGLYGDQFNAWLANNKTPLNITSYLDGPDPDGYYLLRDVNDLKDSLAFTSNANIKFRLVDDISLPQDFYIPYLSVAEFDGDDHIISNLHITSALSSPNMGLFGAVGANTIIKDLGVTDIDITTNSYYIGGLAGQLSSGAQVINSYTTGSITGNGSAIGGLVGYSEGSIIDSHAAVNVTGNSIIGGLVGASSSVSITNSYSTGNVTGTDSVGGLIGANSSGSITNSYATGDITGTTSVGGLMGSNEGGTISNSFYDIDNVLINGQSHVTLGGIYGGQFTTWISNNKTLNIADYLGSPVDGYYLLADIDDLKNALAFTTDTTIKFRLNNDISLPQNFYIPYLSIAEFDGNDHIISNLNITSTLSTSNIGFFSVVGANTTIKDLGVTGININITTSSNYIGGLAGRLYPGAQITNSYTAGSITANNGYLMGGLIGYNQGGAIIDSHSIVNVTGNSYIGGLVGYNSSNSSITNSYATGNITGTSTAGGLVGYNYNSSIADSHATGNVAGNYDTGGLVGQNYSNSSIINSYATGDITGNYNTGGLVGNSYNSSIGNSYSTGMVTGNNSVGGLVGYNYNSSIANSYSNGNMVGNSSFVGGLVGQNYNNSSIIDSYATGDVSGNSSFAGGLVGYSYLNSTVTNSYAIGNITADNYAGGLVGYNDSNSSIANSYATASVTGNYYIGGLAGYNGSNSPITNSYASGRVTGNYYPGGLVGYDSTNNPTSYTANFWNSQTTNVIKGIGSRDNGWSNGVTAKTTSEMKQASIFTSANWDLSTTGPWNIIDEKTYPFHRWRYPSPSYIGGTVYSNSGLAPLANVQIAFTIDGALQPETVRTDAAGAYDFLFLNSAFQEGNALLAYIDNSTQYKGNTVTIASTSNIISGLDIYDSTLIIRHETAGPIRNTDLITAKGSLTDADILYAVDNSLLNINADLFISTDSSFELDANIGASGNWINNGIFYHGQNTVIFNGTSEQIILGETNFYNLTINPGSTVNIGNNNLIVSGDLDNNGLITTSGTGANLANAQTNIGNVTFIGNALALPSKIYGILTLQDGGIAQGNINAAALNLADTLDMNNKALNITNTINNSGLITVSTGTVVIPNAASGDFTFIGDNTIPAATYETLTLNANVTSGGNITADVLSLTSGNTLTMGANSLTVQSTITNAGLVTVSTGSVSLPANVANVGNFTFTGDNTIPAAAYETLTLNANITSGGNITADVLNLASGNTLTMGANSLTVQSTITNTGLVTVSTGNVDIPNAAAGNFTFTAVNTIPTANYTDLKLYADVAAGGNIAASNLELTGTFNITSYSLISDTLNNTGTITTSGNGLNLNIDGDNLGNVTFNSNATSLPSKTYTTLRLEAGGGISEDISITNLILTAGTLDISEHTLNVAGTISGNGTIRTSSPSGANLANIPQEVGNITFSSYVTQLPARNYDTLTLENGGQATGDVMANHLILEQGIFDINNYILNVADDITGNGTIQTSSAGAKLANTPQNIGNVTFTQEATQLPGKTYGTLTLQNGGTARGDINVTTLNLEVGILTMGNDNDLNVSVTGTINNLGEIRISNGNITLPANAENIGDFTFTVDNTTIPSATYGTLTIQADVTAGGNITTDVLNLASNKAITMNTNSLTVNTTLNNEGLVTVSTGDVNMPNDTAGNFTFTAANAIPQANYTDLKLYADVAAGGNIAASSLDLTGTFNIADYTLASATLNNTGTITTSGDGSNLDIDEDNLGDITFTSTASSLPAKTYKTLTLNAGGTTLGDITVEEELALIDRTLDISEHALNIAGTISGNGTIRTSLPTGENLANIPREAGNIAFSNYVTNLPSKTYKTLTLELGGIAAGNVQAENLVLTSGTFDIGAHNLRVDTSITGQGTIQTSSAGVKLANTPQNIGNVTFTQEATQLPGKTYGALTLQNGGTARGDIIVTTLNLEAGLLTMGNNNDLNVTGAINNLGEIKISNGNITLPANAVNVGDFTFTVDNTAIPLATYETLTIQADATAGGDITASSLDLTGTFNIANYGLTSDILNNTGTIITSGNGSNLDIDGDDLGNVTFISTASSLPAKTYKTLTLNAGGTTSGDITIEEELALIDGALDINEYTLDVAGTISGNGTIRTSSPTGANLANIPQEVGNITFSSYVTQLPGRNYNTLRLENGGEATGDVTANHLILEQGTFDIDNYILNVTNDISGDGTIRTTGTGAELITTPVNIGNVAFTQEATQLPGKTYGTLTLQNGGLAQEDIIVTTLNLQVGTLDISDKALNVTGSLNNTGLITVSTGNVSLPLNTDAGDFSFTGANTIPAASYRILTVQAECTARGNITSNTLTLSVDGRLHMQDKNLAVNNTNNFGFISISSGNVNLPTGATNVGNFIFTSAFSTIPAANYKNLELFGADLTAAGDIIAEDLELTGIFNLGSNNLTVSDTLLNNTGTIITSGTGSNLHIGTTNNLGNITFTNDASLLPSKGYATLTLQAGGILQGDITADALNLTGTLDIQGYNLTILDALNNNGTISTSGNGENLSSVNPVNLGNVTFNANASSLPAKTFTILTLNAGGTAPSGTLVINGDFTNNGNFVHNNGTIRFDGPAGTVQNLSPGASNLNNIEHTGAGTLKLPSGNLTIEGNWSNTGGTIDHNSGTVTFGGTGASTILGSTTFYNLSAGSDKTIKFDSTNTRSQTIQGTLSLIGSKGHLVNIDSSDGTHKAKISAVTSDIRFASIENSKNIGNTISPLSSTNLGNNSGVGNNPGWNWANNVITWDGMGNTLNWSEANNWSIGAVPSEYDRTITFNTTNHKDSIVDVDFVGEVADIVISGYTGTITLEKDLEVSGTYTQTSGTFNETKPFNNQSADNRTYSLKINPPQNFNFTSGIFRGATAGTNEAIRIASLAELQAIGTNNDTLSKHYVQYDNIDAAATATWNQYSGTSYYGFDPIGGGNLGAFRGTYNGNNYTISNLYINRSNRNFVGLFGWIDQSAIRNVRLENVNITGVYDTGALIGYSAQSNVVNSSVESGIVNGNNAYEVGGIGGLVGDFYGHYSYLSMYGIKNSYATVNVTGQNGGVVGGLVGKINGGPISNSYSTGNVSGKNNVGGLIGSTSESSVSNSYAAGDVTGTGNNIGGLIGSAGYYVYLSYASGNVNGASSVGGLVGNLSKVVSSSYATGDVIATGSNVGGLVGEMSQGSAISSSYAEGDVTGISNVGGIVGKNTGGQINNSRYNINNVLINGGHHITPGGIYNVQYAEWKNNNKTLNINNYFTINNGYYGINNIDDLKNFLSFADIGSQYKFRLTSDIDLLNPTSPAPSNFYVPYLFVGEFDGNNKTISNFIFNMPSSSVGFFGVVGGGEIKNLTITGSIGNLISPIDNVGGLAGYNNGRITNSSTRVDINAAGNYIGGLVGYNYHSGLITGSHAEGNIHGNDQVGGLVGFNYNSVSTSNAIGEVTGRNYIGGLIGNNGRYVSNSYASGNVTATGDNAGGLIGRNADTINNSYATGNVAGINNIGGLVGSFQYGNIIRSYSTGNVTGTSQVGGLIGLLNSGNVNNSFYNIDGVAINGEYYITVGGIYNDLYNAWILADKTLVIDNHFVKDSDGYYTISNINDLKSLLGFTYSPNKKFRLTSDIDFANPDNPAPTNFYVQYLSVLEFDGNNHTIANLNVDLPSASNIGLFGYVQSGEIKNLNLTNVNINAAGNIGGLVGSLSNNGQMSNSYVQGNITGGGDNVGGLVGYASYFATINDSHTQVDINGRDSIGGLIGRSEAYNTIANSFTQGAVSGNKYVGGLIGYNDSSSTITDSYAETSISGMGEYIGGLIGNIGNYTTITNSYAVGDVTSNSNYIGGLLGKLGSESTITNSYARGDVTGSMFVGGLIGENQSGTITNSYAQGNVTGGGFSGGLVGYNRYSSIINNSYAQGDVTGNGEAVGGLIGYNEYYASITDSYAQGDVIGGTLVGGLIGYNESSTITNSYASGDVSGNSNIGGLIGQNYRDGVINSSYATGDVTGTNDRVGGLVGYNLYQSTITESYAIGDVTGSHSVGGLVGNNRYSSITQSFAVGNITGNYSIGGLVGENLSYNNTITDSYAVGDVTGDNNIGGLVGANYGQIKRSYVTARVTGNNYLGGLVGVDYSDNPNSYSANFWIDQGSVVEASGSNHPDRGIGSLDDTPAKQQGARQKNKNNVKNRSTFDTGNGADNWDFVNTWKNVEGKSRPYLAWQKVVSGTVYEDLEKNTKTENVKLVLAVNGVIYDSSDALEGDTSAGEFYLSPGRFKEGDNVLVFIRDDNKTGNIVTISGINDITDLDIYADNTLVAYSGQGNTITNAHFKKAKGSLNDSHILYSLEDTSSTLDVNAHLVIPNGNTFAPNRDVKVSGNWTNLGNFIAGEATVTFNGTAPQIIESGNSSFYNLVIDTPSRLDIADNQLIVTTMTNNGIIETTGDGSNLIVTSNNLGNVTFKEQADQLPGKGYNQLILKKGASLQGNTTVSDLNLEQGTFEMSSHNLTVNNILHNSGHVIVSTGIVDIPNAESGDFTFTGNNRVPAATYRTLKLYADVAAGGNIAATDLELTRDLNIGESSLTIEGVLTNNGTITTRGDGSNLNITQNNLGNITFNEEASQLPVKEYRVLTLEKGAHLEGNTTVSDLNLEQGTFVVGAHNLTVNNALHNSGHITVSTGTMDIPNAESGNFIFTSNNRVPAASYRTLKLYADVVTDGDISALDLELTRDLNIGENSLSVEGVLNNNGTITTSGDGSNLLIASNNVGNITFTNPALDLPGKHYVTLILKRGGVSVGDITSTNLDISENMFNIGNHNLIVTGILTNNTIIETTGDGSNLNISQDNLGNVRFMNEAAELPAKEYNMLTLERGGKAKGHITASKIDLKDGILDTDGNTIRVEGDLISLGRIISDGKIELDVQGSLFLANNSDENTLEARGGDIDLGDSQTIILGVDEIKFYTGSEAGDIIISGSINGDVEGRSLVLDARGDIIVSGMVGDLKSLREVKMRGSLINVARVNTTGPQEYYGRVIQADGSTMTAETITFNTGGASEIHNITSTGELIFGLADGKEHALYNINSILDISGDVTIEEGAIVNANDSEWLVRGSWLNKGTFNGGTSRVQLKGQDTIEILGSNNFYDLISEEPGKTFIFEAGTTQRVEGSLTLKGMRNDLAIPNNAAINNNLIILKNSKSNADPLALIPQDLKWWHIDLPDDETKIDVENVFVVDSYNDNKLYHIDPLFSMDGGNNFGWFTPSVTESNHVLTWERPDNNFIALPQPVVKEDKEDRINIDKNTALNGASISRSSTSKDGLELWRIDRGLIWWEEMAEGQKAQIRIFSYNPEQPEMDSSTDEDARPLFIFEITN